MLVPIQVRAANRAAGVSAVALREASYNCAKACYDAISDLPGGGGEHPVAKTTAAAVYKKSTPEIALWKWGAFPTGSAGIV